MVTLLRLVGVGLAVLVGSGGLAQAQLFTVDAYNITEAREYTISGTFAYDGSDFANWNLTAEFDGQSDFVYTPSTSMLVPSSSNASNLRLSVDGLYEVWLSFEAQLGTLEALESTSILPGSYPEEGSYTAWCNSGVWTSERLAGTVTRQETGTPEVPEPSTFIILSAALGLVALSRQRRGR